MIALAAAAALASLFPHTPAGALETRAAARPAPFAGIISNPLTGVRTRVGCFDPLSLRPTSPPVVIGEYHHAWSVSPDGSRVALGISASGATGRVGVRIVELGAWTAQLDVETGIAAAGVAWLTDRRLVAGLLDGSIVLLDPVTGAVVDRWSEGSGTDAATARTRRRFLVLGSGRRAGRLSAVDARGRLRSLSLRYPADAPARLRPALVADPRRERAYVLMDARTVIDVDLSRMRVRRLRLRPAPRPVERAGDVELRRWQATWLGRGRVALSGYDQVSRRGGRAATAPVGLSTIDTRSGATVRIDADANGVTRAPRRLLTYGLRGVRGYTLGGRRVFEVLPGKRVWNLDVAGRLAYAGTRTATYVIDTRSGRVRGRIPRWLDLDGVISRSCQRP
jgi:hypothetical protein